MLATLGFTVDFIIRRIADLEHDERLEDIVLVGLDTGDGTWKRVEQTYNLVSHYLTSIGIRGELKRLRLAPGLVSDIKDEIVNALGKTGSNGILELFLTGGPRMLIVAVMLAAYTLDDDESSRVRIVSYGEGFPGSIQAWLLHIKALNRLDVESRMILKNIRDGVSTVKKLLEVMDIPRSTLYKKLDDLARLGLIEKTGAGAWRIQRDVENLI